MKNFINNLLSNWNLGAALLALPAWVYWMIARVTDSALMWVLCAVYACTAAGLVLRMRWARIFGIGLLCWLMVTKLANLVQTEFTWNRLIHAGALGFIAHGLWRKPDNGIVDDWREGDEADESQEEGEEAIISLVQLRKQPRYLEASVLAAALSEAWGLNLAGGGEGDGGDEESADGFVVGQNPLFIVLVKKPAPVMFTVHNHDSNYFNEPEEVAGSAPNLRFQQVIREHGAWLAVDLMQVTDTKLAHDDAYRMIGKAVSALADDEVLAICCPQHNYFNLWSPKLEDLLCGEAPLEALLTEVKAPVFGVPDSEWIEAAVTEARRRWPEFVSAFQKREPGDERFLVKAPFTGENGEVEHMWLQVFGLETEYVHGHLLNEPIHTARLKQGSQVEVPVSDVSDWLHPDSEGRPVGNFTQEAVGRAARGAEAA